MKGGIKRRAATQVSEQAIRKLHRARQRVAANHSIRISLRLRRPGPYHTAGEVLPAASLHAHAALDQFQNPHDLMLYAQKRWPILSA